MITDMNNLTNKPKQLAIIGSTASGKSALAVDIAKRWDGIVLSLDSLAVYKEIDIVSAKPTLKEQEGIAHYGIDLLYPNEAFDVTIFMKLYQEVYKQAIKENKTLIVVGGSSFYLKSMIDGISILPLLSDASKQELSRQMLYPQEVYKRLFALDEAYMSSIKSNDTYRIEKALSIYLATNTAPSLYFKANPPIPTIIGNMPIYAIDTPRDILRQRIIKRTESMLESGLIDEVAKLEYKYTRQPNAMKSIGIKETLEYLDGRVDKKRFIEKIITNTARLAKRQNTFNKSQFKKVVLLELEELKERILNDY